MGHDPHQSANSSGAVAVIVAGVLIVAILGIFAVAGAAVFWIRSDRMQMRQAVEIEQRLGVDLARAEAEKRRVAAELRVQSHVLQNRQANAGTAFASSRSLELFIDQEGRARIDGAEVTLPDLRATLSQLKEESSNTLVLQIKTDAACQVKHLIPVLNVCQEVGDVDFRIVPSGDADPTAGQRDAVAESGS